MWDSEDPVLSSKVSGMGHFLCIYIGLGLKYTAVKQTKKQKKDDPKSFQLLKMRTFTCIFFLPYQTSQRVWHWAGEWCK